MVMRFKGDLTPLSRFHGDEPVMREIKRFDAPSGASFGQVLLFEEGWLFKVQRFQEDEIPQMKVRHTSDRDRAEELFEQWKREIVEDEAVKALRGGK